MRKIIRNILNILQELKNRLKGNRELSRISVINSCLKTIRGNSYLEIGIGTGKTITKIKSNHKVGVDPKLQVNKAIRQQQNTKLYELTSDQFFKKNKEKYDVIFVDGLHLYEQAIRDILNSLNVLTKNGVIIAHDCNPKTERVASRTSRKGVWSGDVWKAIYDLKLNYKNLDYFCLASDFGLGIITKKNPEDKFEAKVNKEIIRLPYKTLEKERDEILNLKTKNQRKEFHNFLRYLKKRAHEIR